VVVRGCQIGWSCCRSSTQTVPVPLSPAKKTHSGENEICTAYQELDETTTCQLPGAPKLVDRKTALPPPSPVVAHSDDLGRRLSPRWPERGSIRRWRQWR
jgi:hypothetical protein